MKTLRTVMDVRHALAPFRGSPAIGLVPTMGAFHAGHVALFETARRTCSTVVASLFVNPVQFGDPADLASYPRDEERDRSVAAEAGVDFLFCPDVETMYPSSYATWIDVHGPALGLESTFRPGHFRAVATVCVKLFLIVRPDVAFFGQKDGQQVAVVSRVVTDLNLDIDLVVVPTVRDADGLALSSRNSRLTSEERQRARAIPQALEAGLRAYQEGRDPVAAARTLLADIATEYVAIADFEGQPALAIAARVGTTRLIDNVPLGPEYAHG